MNNSIEETIEDLLKKAFERIIGIYPGYAKLGSPCQTTNPKALLAFPAYYNGIKKEKPRISEQEMRFLFIETILEEKPPALCHYAIEAPTEKCYKFSGGITDSPVSTGGRSASIDVCLYFKNPARPEGEDYVKAYIEFKAGNPAPKSIAIKKDFLKLLQDAEGMENYFVHIVESGDDYTLMSIREKYAEAIERAVKPPFLSNLTVFLLFLNQGRHGLYRFSIYNPKAKPALQTEAKESLL